MCINIIYFGYKQCLSVIAYSIFFIMFLEITKILKILFLLQYFKYTQQTNRQYELHICETNTEILIIKN